jgi:prepilin signal peptidase PulO-like enzyme (type II secretory pathway)
MSFLDLFAVIVLITVIASIVAIFVALGMLPGHIARQRRHPWAEAVAIGGWVTLIFGFVFWPLVMIWAHVDFPEKREAAP